MSKGLTNKQKLFIREYMIDLNQAAAARRAGYSPRSSKAQGRQLMATPGIRAEIRKAMARRAERVEASADEVLRALTEIAHVDKTVAFRVQDGILHVTDTDLLPPPVRRCISKIAQTQHGIRIEFDDRVKALELLGRHLAMFTDNVNLNDNRPKPLEEMTEEEIDAELARIEAQKASAGKEAGQGEGEPS